MYGIEGKGFEKTTKGKRKIYIHIDTCIYMLFMTGVNSTSVERDGWLRIKTSWKNSSEPAPPGLIRFRFTISLSSIGKLRIPCNTKYTSCNKNFSLMGSWKYTVPVYVIVELLQRFKMIRVSHGIYI